MVSENLKIREMEDDEKPRVLRIARETIPFFYYLFTRYNLYSSDPIILVALKDDEIVGASIFDTIEQGPRKIGQIDYIFVDSSVQGEGVGSRLFERTEEFLISLDVDEIFSDVEGYNSPSWKIHEQRGYSRLRLSEQIKLWRYRTPLIWLLTFYFLALGHNLLWKGLTIEKPDRRTNFFEPIAIVLIIAMIGTLGINGFSTFSLWVLAILLLNILVYEGSSWITGKKLGYKPKFRSWENGITISLIIGFFGGFIPVYGSTYLSEKGFNHHKNPEVMGKMTGMSILAGLLLTTGFMIASQLTNIQILGTAAIISLIFYIFQSILIFAPFGVLKGRQLYRWSPKIWFIFMAAGIALTTILFIQ
ncbi:GNAT family N-acetyltransferase [Methanonatronarchaeum sp. AMET6-2]|uniref:GNAT family N-acetyltransferase n=1 Tax=Methanonatronarchaeum sp. AMET6-2 TaxID=2933293 RepID=UPI001FF1B561|nr:GNAT family N-acetyltransferase [Methanonatronarchaeum sp. AMET6-2]UOY10668.1 GNAT family N-acetyltransferase [Methanonatronarchaeum sp. AMET6-2]